jgi:hypothetical protein
VSLFTDSDWYEQRVAHWQALDKASLAAGNEAVRHAVLYGASAGGAAGSPRVVQPGPQDEEMARLLENEHVQAPSSLARNAIVTDDVVTVDVITGDAMAAVSGGPRLTANTGPSFVDGRNGRSSALAGAADGEHCAARHCRASATPFGPSPDVAEPSGTGGLYKAERRRERELSGGYGAANAEGCEGGDVTGGVAAAAQAMVRIDGGFSMPAALYDRLFPYQQVGVKWMWELHLQRAGGALPSTMFVAAVPVMHASAVPAPWGCCCYCCYC